MFSSYGLGTQSTSMLHSFVFDPQPLGEQRGCCLCPGSPEGETQLCMGEAVPDDREMITQSEVRVYHQCPWGSLSSIGWFPVAMGSCCNPHHQRQRKVNDKNPYYECT